MKTETVKKHLLTTTVLIPSLVLSVPGYAFDHKYREAYLGTSKHGYSDSRYQHRNYNHNKHNRSRAYIGINYGYPARYRGSYIGFGYRYPLSYRRNYNDWRYNNHRHDRQYSNRRYNNSDRLIATATGVFIGALVVSEIGRYLDDVDRMRARNANITARSAPLGQQINWNNPQTNHYGSTTATRDGYSESGKYCREFYQTISIGNRNEQAYGTACQQPDGSWQIVQPLN